LTPPRPRTFADPRSWWCCWPKAEWPTALPWYIAKKWRRDGQPVWFCTHEQACAMQRRLRARAAEAEAVARRDGQGQFSLFGTEAAA
jgi:hypothetical protein